ncbi:MAG: 3-deoxy-7-phosphoheptulonate synthase [Firmicutes bacterium]|nr:3-deoxy-7-phosphoheptulonate synthase [Bacillota bacterium]
MLIVMDKNADDAKIDGVVAAVEKAGFSARRIPGGHRTAVGVIHNGKNTDPDRFLNLPGVREVIPVTKPYKLVSREFKPEDTVVKVKNAVIGGSSFAVIAGPCAVESREQTDIIADMVKKSGGTILRGGAFKPRTSPYSFQGLGEDGLKILAAASDRTGLPFVSEAVDEESLEIVARYADMIQIGARNMQNFSLLKKAGAVKRPILLKRGICATVEELLMAAEYILEAGNPDVVLCERGVRTFADHCRNILDLSAVTVIRKESHLPVIVDPSHSAGRREQVVPLGLAAAAAGAQGLIAEVHHCPEEALCDGAQALLPNQLDILCKLSCQISEMIKGAAI